MFPNIDDRLFKVTFSKDQYSQNPNLPVNDLVKLLEICAKNNEFLTLEFDVKEDEAQLI